MQNEIKPCRTREAAAAKSFSELQQELAQLRAERDAAIAALAGQQAASEELAQMRDLLVALRDQVATLERALMTPEERARAAIYRSATGS